MAPLAPPTPKVARSFSESGRVPEDGLRVPREREVHFEVDGPHQDAPQKPRRRYYGLFALLIIVAYFWPLQSAPPVKRMRLRLKSPKIPQKLQILTARPTRFKWRRDGAIEVEANVINCQVYKNRGETATILGRDDF